MTQCSSSSVHSSTQRPDTSEQRWQREASPSPWYRRRMFFLCGCLKVKADLSVTRKSTCPLSDGSEPLCHAGSGLPDDRRGPDAAGGRGCCEAPQRRVSQPRLPAAAPDPRHEPGQGAEETSARARTVKHTRTLNGTDVRASHADIRTRLDCHRGQATPAVAWAPLAELRKILWTDRKPVEPVNQVWPSLYIGDEWVDYLQPASSNAA